jgi:hypothetical protein
MNLKKICCTLAVALLICMGVWSLATIIGGHLQNAVHAQGVAVSVAADITGDGSAHAITSSGTARWVLIIAHSTNSATARCGASTTSSTRGFPIAAGGGLMLPPALNQDFFPLAQVYCYAANGDKLSVGWGN